MTFTNYSRQVVKLAKQQGKGYLVPDNDTLYRLWELKIIPEIVVKEHCTLEASRNGMDDKSFRLSQLSDNQIAGNHSGQS